MSRFDMISRIIQKKSARGQKLHPLQTLTYVPDDGGEK